MDSPYDVNTKRTGAFRALRRYVGLLSLCVGVIAFLPEPGLSKTKPPRAPAPEPELKIVELTMTPTPYIPASGSLELAVTVQLPKELNGATILEVSSLISSASKTSLKFRSRRQSVQAPPSNADNETPQRLSVKLSWNGQDHRKQLAGPGIYAYEVRSKLLMDGEKGPRTLMVSWPKRGTLEVK
jgi:hypothetical protein